MIVTVVAVDVRDVVDPDGAAAIAVLVNAVIAAAIAADVVVTLLPVTDV